MHTLKIKKIPMSSQNCPLGANIFNLKMYYIQYPVKKKKERNVEILYGCIISQ